MQPTRKAIGRHQLSVASTNYFLFSVEVLPGPHAGGSLTLSFLGDVLDGNKTLVGYHNC